MDEHTNGQTDSSEIYIVDVTVSKHLWWPQGCIIYYRWGVLYFWWEPKFLGWSKGGSKGEPEFYSRPGRGGQKMFVQTKGRPEKIGNRQSQIRSTPSP